MGAGARCAHIAPFGAITHITFTPRLEIGNWKLDPHRKVLDSNIATKKTAKKWVSHQSTSLSAPPMEAIGMASVKCVAKMGNADSRCTHLTFRPI